MIDTLLQRLKFTSHTFILQIVQCWKTYLWNHGCFSGKKYIGIIEHILILRDMWFRPCSCGHIDQSPALQLSYTAIQVAKSNCYPPFLPTAALRTRKLMDFYGWKKGCWRAGGRVAGALAIAVTRAGAWKLIVNITPIYFSGQYHSTQ
jgi:hypothetical protein